MSDVAREIPNDTWLTRATRALMHAIASAVFGIPLAHRTAVISAAIASVIGVLLGQPVAQSRWRTGVLILGAALVAGAAWLFAHVLGESHALAAWLSPATALRAADGVRFGLIALVLSLTLRALAMRRRAYAIGEIAFVAGAFAELLAAHRNGAINRPFELADPILAAGGDPTVAILSVGGTAVGVMLLLLLEERSRGRTLLHLVAVAIFVVGIFSATRLVGIPAPPPSDAGVGNRTEGNSSPSPSDAPNERPAPVAVVLLNDDYSPPTGTYYFRQAALSHFNGHRLVAANRNDVDLDIARSFPAATVRLDHPPLGTDRVEVHTRVALLADHSKPFGLESIEALTPAANPNPARFVRVYDVTSVALRSDYLGLLGVNAGSASWSDEVRAYYTEGPTDARYGELARTIVEALPETLRQEPIAQVLAVTEWLGKQGVYSLRTHHRNTEDFLFGDKTGYCVDFAHAAATLLRSIGLPARVATGYQSPESVRQGGSTIVLTDGFAHAWPEVYLDGVGWIVADVAPARSLDPPPSPPDPDLQRLLGQLARGDVPTPPGTESIPPLVARARAALLFVAERAGFVVALALLLLYLAKAWRRVAPRFVSDKAYARVAYRAFLDRLGDSGNARAIGESRERFAARLQRVCPSFGRVTDEHLAARFGGAWSRTRMNDAARDAVRELREAVPFWRRFLGALSPLTFFKSR